MLTCMSAKAAALARVIPAMPSNRIRFLMISTRVPCGSYFQLSACNFFCFMVAMAEYHIRLFLLGVRHHGIQSRKSARKLLDAVGMNLRNFRIGIQIIDGRRAGNGGITLVN